MNKGTKVIIQNALKSELFRFENALQSSVRSGKMPTEHIEKLQKKIEQIKNDMVEVEAV